MNARQDMLPIVDSQPPSIYMRSRQKMADILYRAFKLQAEPRLKGPVFRLSPVYPADMEHLLSLPPHCLPHL